MVKHYLIFLCLVIVNCSCGSANNAFHVYTLIGLSKDIEQANDTTIVVLRPLLKDSGNYIVVKNFQILFADTKDSILTKSKKEYVVKYNMEHVPNIEYEIVTSTFDALSNKVYFSDKYRAKLNFNYLYQDSIHTHSSVIAFKNK